MISALKNTDRSGEDAREGTTVLSLRIFFSVLHSFCSCHLLGVVIGPLEKTVDDSVQSFFFGT